ncbi:MAG: glycosyltransferase [Vicinamibacterales bacterium]
MTAPLAISVIVACHNAAPYLHTALRSAWEQSEPPLELIVVDDGSTDDSAAIAAEFARSRPQVTVLAGGRCGAPAARNLGAAQASGDALLFLDADDVLGRQALSSMGAALGGSHDEAAVAVGPWSRLELHRGAWRVAPRSCPDRQPGEDPLSAWLRGWYHPPCAVLWAATAFERAGRWDEQCHQNNDGDLMMRALVEGVALTEATTGRSYYRRAPAGRRTLSSARYEPDRLLDRIRVVAKIAVRLDGRDDGDRWAPPLHAAFTRIARDAEAVSPDIARLARRHAARHGRLRRVHRRRGLPPVPRPSPPVRASGPPAASQPRVSVIIPTYNRAATVTRAVRSALDQAVPDVEVLVVDDGSTDDTAARLAGIDHRVRVLRQPGNEGAAAARNRGLRAARGQAIAFLDSDDVWLPDKLARQLAVLDGAPAGVGLVYGGVLDDRGDGTVGVDRAQHRGDLFRPLLERNVVHGGGSNVLMRRSVVAAVGFFDERFEAIEDYDYWLRAARLHDFDHVGDPVVRYHNGDAPGRRSRCGDADAVARERFYRKHRIALRAEGVADRFLLESARRVLRRPSGDRHAARRLAWRAVRARPVSRRAWGMALRLSTPAAFPRVRSRGGRHTSPAGERPLRVLLYTSTSSGEAGGVQMAFGRLAGELRQRGHTVTEARADGVASDGRGRLVLPLAVPAVHRRVLPEPRSTARAVASALRLAAAVVRVRADVVNVHFLYPPEVLHFTALRPLLRYRLVLSAHGSDILQPVGPKQWLLPAALRRADALTAVSAELAEAMTRRTGLPSAVIHRIANTVDVSWWRPPADDGCGGPIAPSAPTVVAVGRLEPVKGFDVLLDAWAVVVAAVPAARLVVVGDGSEAAALRAQAARLGVGGSVAFTGRLDHEQLRRRLHRACVFVLPSRREGMPLSLLEAMAAGLAPVVSDLDGLNEVVGDGAAVVVAPGDAAALAAAIEGLLRRPLERRAIAAAAQERVRSLQADGSPGARYERLFQDLLARPAGRGAAATAGDR